MGSGDAGRAAERLLAKMIRQLRMGRYSDGGKEHLLFDGEANQLAFIRARRLSMMSDSQTMSTC